MSALRPMTRPTRRVRRVRRSRSLIAVGLVASSWFTISTEGAPVRADHGSAEAEQAAREIQAARDRANAAAQALFDAESDIDTLAIQITDAEDQLATIEAQADEIRRSLEAAAVRRFTQAGGTNFVLLGDFSDANDDLRTEMFAAVTQETATVDLDDFDAVMSDVEDARDDLDDRRREAEQATEDYATLQKQAEAEIVRLGEVEAQRQIDAAVEDELQRQRDERAEAARVAAAAQAAADARDAEATAARQLANRQTATPAAAQAPAAAPTGASDSSSDNRPADPAPAPAPAPVEPAPPADAGSAMTCPIRGNYGFADTWGAARSGGRRHQGVDMIASSGTQLVAAESGSVRFSTNRLGGNAVWVTGNSGTKYYYAHLSSFTGSNRSVSQGEEIGKVGSTGNAGTAHLHFEVHPGGGTAVNPYPYVAAVC